MIERTFWEEVRSHWILEIPPQISDLKTSSGGEIDPSLLEDPWGQEGIPFDMVDYDDAMEAALAGEDYQAPKGRGYMPKAASGKGFIRYRNRHHSRQPGQVSRRKNEKSLSLTV